MPEADMGITAPLLTARLFENRKCNFLILKKCYNVLKTFGGDK